MLESLDIEAQLKELLTDLLRLGERGANLVRDSALLGSIPELDSMAVVSVLTVIEEQYDVEFDDEDVSADSFATLGSLCSLVESKLATS